MQSNDSAESMLEAAYRDLGFAEGDLRVATKSPSDAGTPDDWVERGEWLATAKEARAETVFFVDGNPVVVFAKHSDNDPVALRRMINRIWCMARPRLLFLALPGELRVFDLADGPISPDEESTFLQSDRVLEFARGIRNVQRILCAYSREQVESGRLFEGRRFEKASNRADETLIRDLRTVRARLMEIATDCPDGARFELKHAHALIGRSIFIRYLEDRNILIPDHFREIAANHPEWQQILSDPYEKENIEPDMGRTLYPKVLADREFTYALFDWLAHEFNGDMFPRDPSEQQVVTSAHLDLLRRFLLADGDDQTTLFFYAYNFEVIPIELISSVYEEFYTEEIGKKADRGTHYTPSALVEFVLSRVLTPARLAENPRILDPACGSGIFLVEAFRRIVRYRISCQKGKPLEAEELRDILRNQIAGIEINPEAVRIAAFSLYLALLDYQDPSNIRAHPRLPNLVYDNAGESDRNARYDILLPANAFNLQSLANPEIRARFGSSSADIVIGNPPWGFPNKKNVEMVAAANLAFKWCQQKRREVGDRELSQAFIHRTIDFLKDGGIAGLLVSSGVLFKSHKKSQKFRKQWLRGATLEHVVNFVHVRDVFFSNAIAPFISAVFTKQTAQALAPFEYWSAKRTAMTSSLRAPVLSRVDLRLLSQDEVRRWDDMWKIHWWGSHRDEALIRKLQLNPPLGQIKVAGRRLVQISGRGYQDCPNQKAQKPSDKLRQYKDLWTEDLRPYGPLNFNRPDRIRDTVHNEGRLGKDKKPALYDGIRLLFGRGVRSGKEGRAGAVVRLAFDPFCFRNSIHALRLAEGTEEEAKIVLAICWSSLLRYYLFLTVGSWGTWHDEIQLEQHVRRVPIRLPEDKNLRQRITHIVDELLQIDRYEGDMTLRIPYLESSLDEAVFDLYELTEAERDLVLDMCATGLNLFYHHERSHATKPVDIAAALDRNYGVLADLPWQRTRSVTMAGYLYAFLKTWNRELEPDGEFRWQVVYPTSSSPTVIVVFSTQYKRNPLPPPDETDLIEGRQILRHLGEASIQHYGSRGIFTDSLVRSVSPNRIVIMKRNEQRLWTRSMAREDAEATMFQAMYLQETMRDALHGSA